MKDHELRKVVSKMLKTFNKILLPALDDKISNLEQRLSALEPKPKRCPTCKQIIKGEK